MPLRYIAAIFVLFLSDAASCSFSGPGQRGYRVKTCQQR